MKEYISIFKPKIARRLLKMGNPIHDIKADKEGFNHKHIIECCKGKAKTYKGYKWMYYEDYIKLNIG